VRHRGRVAGRGEGDQQEGSKKKDNVSPKPGAGVSRGRTEKRDIRKGNSSESGKVGRGTFSAGKLKVI